MPSAVIVRVRLPAPLEALRRRSVADATDGMPAHVTLLYPFMEPPSLDAAAFDAIAAVLARHRPFDFRIVAPRRWPDTVYAAVQPAEPFVRLQADFAAAFPAFPIYERPAGFLFVPHITIGEGPAVEDPRTMTDAAWTALPAGDRAEAVEVIAGDAGSWSVVRRLPSAAASSALARMRP